MLASFGLCPEVFETDAQILVIGATLDLEGAQLASYGSRPVAFVGEGGVGKLTTQFLEVAVEDFGAGVSVE